MPLLYGVIISLVLGIFRIRNKPEASGRKIKVFVHFSKYGRTANVLFCFLPSIDYLVSSLPFMAHCGTNGLLFNLLKKINEDFKDNFSSKTLLFIFTLIIVALTIGGNLSGGSLGFPFHQFYLGALYLFFINSVLVLPYYSSHQIIKPSLFLIPTSIVVSVLFFMMNSLINILE